MRKRAFLTVKLDPWRLLLVMYFLSFVKHPNNMQRWRTISGGGEGLIEQDWKWQQRHWTWVTAVFRGEQRPSFGSSRGIMEILWKIRFGIGIKRKSLKNERFFLKTCKFSSYGVDNSIFYQEMFEIKISLLEIFVNPQTNVSISFSGWKFYWQHLQIAR